MDAYVALDDGTIAEGRGRVSGTTNGEIVFTTAYAGYEESLTDPSYRKQILTFAYPLIGNYGVRGERFESDTIHPEATIARELTDNIVAWLREEGVPAIDRIDTRKLVVSIRNKGAMRCGIAVGEDVTPDDARAQLDACAEMGDHSDIGSAVSVSRPVKHEPRMTNWDLKIALLDCGVKRSITDSFLDRGVTVYQLPYDAEAAAIDAIDPDLFFISNGPGDPASFGTAEQLVSEFAGEIPIAGICLGQQIVARALGGSTEKLPFGHRGVNQPVRDLEREQVLITTQNHGYNVGDPGQLEVTQVNLNDDTAEGLISRGPEVITRQYHPEANPGPRDTLGFFDDMVTMAQSGMSASEHEGVGWREETTEKTD